MAMAAWSARSPARFFSSAVKSSRRPNPTMRAPTARSWWISGSAMHRWRSLVSAIARCRHRGSCWTSSMYSGRHEAQVGVCSTERLLDDRRCLGAGEDEAEILPTLGERNHVLPRVHRDRDVLDPVDRRGVVHAVDRREPARPRNRNHHDTGGAMLALERLQGAPERVAEDELLEAQARAEGQRA